MLIVRVLNKQGKDYSQKSATAIQREYLTMNSTKEAILEARKRAHSATSPFEIEEAQSDPTPLNRQSDAIPSSYTRKLLTNKENQAEGTELHRHSTELERIPVVMATPSLFSPRHAVASFIEAFNLLDISKKHRRALSIGSLLDYPNPTIQYFNPEFDPSSGTSFFPLSS